MSVERVKSYLKHWNRENDIIELSVSTATSILAAEALGVELGRIAKSITIKSSAGCLLLVTSCDTRIDNKKFKAALGFSPKMLSSDQALELTGYAVGGICPFDMPSQIEIYFDESLKRFTTVFPACGSSSSMIELTIAQLEEYAKSQRWVEVCNIIQV